MRNLITALFVFSSVFAFAQGGKIYLKDVNQTANGAKTFVYESAQGSTLPENCKANIICDNYTPNLVPVRKVGKVYEFKASISDTVNVAYCTIVDSTRNTIDDNFGKGYVVLFKNRNRDEIIQSALAQLEIVRYANSYLQLSISMQDIVDQYDKLYAENPELKNRDSYLNYLLTKYQIAKEETKPELLSYAQTKASTGIEKDMRQAYIIYETLNMGDKSAEINEIALQKYPTGVFAKSKFWTDFYSKQNKTIDDVIDAMKQYGTTFQDTTQLIKDRFYQSLIPLYLANKDTISAENLKDCNKNLLAYAYNDFAWQLSGGDLSSAGKDLDFAASISRKSMEMARNLLEQSKEKDREKVLQDNYNMYADTYALILFKQGKYDLAFQYQDAIAKQDGMNDDGSKERYATFAEKAKGAEFAKKYIESQLDRGVVSVNLLKQLQAIYQKLNLPETDYKAIKQKAENTMENRMADDVQKILGTTKAIDFELTNLDGKTIKLSDYKGKVIVLDFWATWCGPCRASFPRMQNLITNYKDKNAAFFFIDCFEHNSKDKVKENVSKFIADNKYTFNVLFDFDDVVAGKYKVHYIPHQFVIDKTGTIIAIDPSESVLPTLIEKNL